MTTVTITNHGPGPAEVSGVTLDVGQHRQFDLQPEGLTVIDPMLLPPVPAPAVDPTDLNAENPGGGS